MSSALYCYLFCFGFNLPVSESFQKNSWADPQELRESIRLSFGDYTEPVATLGSGSPTLPHYRALGQRGPQWAGYGGTLP